VRHAHDAGLPAHRATPGSARMRDADDATVSDGDRGRRRSVLRHAHDAGVSDRTARAARVRDADHATMSG
jgi:hypothetical protein